MDNLLPQKAVTYYRVSTQQQGKSGLGLEAQHTAVRHYVQRTGLEVVDSYTEVETGTSKRERPKIKQAIAAAKEQGAVLVVAKLDRLARNVRFIATLRDSGVPFVATDMPDANSLTVNIMASLAEYEAQMISQRTKAALDAAKARGKQLGTPENLTDKARAKGAKVNAEKAVQAQRQAAGYAANMRRNGMTYAAIAEQLTSDGFFTRQGRKFKPMTVKRMLDRTTV